MVISGPDKHPKSIFRAALILFLVGMHSILLGLTIYFFTDFFYDTFFATPVENIFFVRQSGTFLFLAGLFYLYPLVNLRKFYNLVLLVIVSKIVAVVFLVTNAGYTTAPAMIYLAALFDGLMGAAVIGAYFRCRQVYARSGPSIAPTENAKLQETV